MMKYELIQSQGVIEVRCVDGRAPFAFARAEFIGEDDGEMVGGIGYCEDDRCTCNTPATYKVTICDAPELQDAELGPDEYKLCHTHAALSMGLFFIPDASI